MSMRVRYVKEDGAVEGLEHLLPIGDASASLGLVSTLVLSITLEKLFSSANNAARGSMTLLLAVASAFSTFTTTYSILEFYYIQTLHHAAIREQAREKQRAPQKETDGEPLESNSSKEPFAYSELSPYEEFSTKVTGAFAGFNGLRAMARNSMWISLVFMFSAVVTLLDFTEAFQLNLNRPFKAAAVLAWVTIVVGISFLKTTQDYFMYLIGFFSFCFSVCIVDGFIEEDRLPMQQVMTCVVVISAIVIIPLTVGMFRDAFLHMAKLSGDVY
jgi:hypothetical protein